MTTHESASEELRASEADAHACQGNQRDDQRPCAASATVVAARVLLLVAAAGALTAGIVLTRARDRARESARQSTAVNFLCPMHPEVVSPVAADCPICGMALEPVDGAAKVPLERPGYHAHTVAVEQRTVSQTVRAPAWLAADGLVTAVLHRDDLVGCQPGELARFFPATTPAAGKRVRFLAFAGQHGLRGQGTRRPGSEEPAMAWTLTPETKAWDGATVQVEFALDEPKAPDPDTGWLQLETRAREVLVVPESAILYSGQGTYVLAAPENDHVFKQRLIQIGRILDSGHVAESAGDHFGAVVVLAGLQPGERVVAADTFFADAQRRLQAAQGMAAEVVE